MEQNDTRIGCFQWFATLKKSLNERYARARNRLIKRFRRSHPTVHAADLVNDTGTPDLVFSKRPLSASVDAAQMESVLQLARAKAELIRTIEQDQEITDVAVSEQVRADPKLDQTESSHSVRDQEMREFVASYVKDVINSSQARLEAETNTSSPGSPTPSAISAFASDFSMTILLSEKVKLEAEARRTSPESITSSQADEIAELAVQESLTNIVADTNESAIRRPKTVSEAIAALGFGSMDRDDGLPRVDI